MLSLLGSQKMQLLTTWDGDGGHTQRVRVSRNIEKKGERLIAIQSITPLLKHREIFSE